VISDRIRQAFVLLFVLGFFAYLFGPLIIMGMTAFNSSAFPRVTPWECFSVEWFSVLAQDHRLLEGLKNSLLIGFGVVCVSVPLGLAGALMLTQVNERARPWYYTIVISPILVPGVVLGISTLLFWDRIGTMFGASRDSIFYDGFFLTIIGQSTFISAYTMLVFISRLQRFETVQEEAGALRHRPINQCAGCCHCCYYNYWCCDPRSGKTSRVSTRQNGCRCSSWQAT